MVDPDPPRARVERKDHRPDRFDRLRLVAVGLLAGALLSPLALSGPAGSAINATPLSIALSMAGVTGAVWAVARGDRRWVSWTAGGIAAVPTAFWIVFALGYLIDLSPAPG